ncbi:hypothetical protein ACLOJK_004049 [Asimina triloba]
MGSLLVAVVAMEEEDAVAPLPGSPLLQLPPSVPLFGWTSSAFRRSPSAVRPLESELPLPACCRRSDGFWGSHCCNSSPDLPCSAARLDALPSLFVVSRGDGDRGCHGCRFGDLDVAAARWICRR